MEVACHVPETPGLGASDPCGMFTACGFRWREETVSPIPAKPVEIRQEEDVWVLRVQQSDGKVQEYRCNSENQAKQLAQVLTPREQPSP
jgi:hypothetical protein